MPLAFTQLAAASATTNNLSSYAGNAGTPVADNLLICFVVSSGNTNGTLTGGGFTWTRLTSITKNAGVDTIYVFWAYADTATSTTPTFATIGGAATGCCIHCIRITGADGQRQPYIRQSKTNTGTTANPSVVFDNNPLTGNGILCFIANGSNSTAQFTVPTGFGQIGAMAYNTPPNGAQTSSRATGQTTPTLTWTNANTTSWSVIAIELYEAGTGIIEPWNTGSGTGFFGGSDGI